MRLKPAPCAGFADEGEGIELQGCAKPEVTTPAWLDVHLKLRGITFAQRAVRAIGGNNQVGLADFAGC